jgi:dihydrodipicolinate synthase/N-acetylneuraminate lyase
MVTVEAALQRIVPRRKIEGMSAILLPYKVDGRIDYDGFTRHLLATTRAGLTSAVNMDTGYGNLLTLGERLSILKLAQECLAGGAFVAGAFIEGQPGDMLSLYYREVETIQAHGGTPIMFQCSGLKTLTPGQVVQAYQSVAARCQQLLAFELGEMFAPFGQIYSLDLVRELIQIPQITGMKHSSLRRGLEWQRLALRDEVRPDFKIYTGNDLAVDMVMYGSDYLLGLTTFAPEAFALRDRLWAEGDAGFHELNDLLQYLGTFAFRPPVPAYKHSAAQFLKLRGRIECSEPHPQSPRRPESDIAILQDIATRLGMLTE